MRILTLFGTRPEAVKVAPIIKELDSRSIDHIVCSTGQHREMLEQVCSIFGIKPDVDLRIMKEAQSLDDISSSILQKFGPVLDEYKPDVVLVQGDTASAFVAGLVAFYRQIPVAHVEAGLRSHNKYNPFPEEMNRILLSRVAQHHFAPTKLAAQNLQSEGIKDEIYITGNTVIDALQWVVSHKTEPHTPELKQFEGKKTILITSHRRENLGEGMDNIFGAIAYLAEKYPDYHFVFPVHLNPAVQKSARKHLESIQNVHLFHPFDYLDLTWMLNHCDFVMTDSGGIQEEAPSLGKPVLVLRKTTERTEGVDAGTALLVGIEKSDIIKHAERLIEDRDFYNQMSHTSNPYGDGTAAKQIVDILERLYA